MNIALTLLLKMKKPRHREVRHLAQGRTATKWLSQDLRADGSFQSPCARLPLPKPVLSFPKAASVWASATESY